MPLSDAELLQEVQRRLIERHAQAERAGMKKLAARFARLHAKLNRLLPLCAQCGIDVAPLSGGQNKPPRP